jgi:chromate reductase, NAD(P)H dehydrogenase (quinone)
MNDLKVLVIAGSARRGALSVQLAQAAAVMLRDSGAQATTLDLRALALPIYDGDIEAEQGVPPGAAKLRDALRSHDALLLVTPEYNGFPTPLVINAFDWLSRLKADADMPAALALTASKPVALLSSSPGPLGGLRSMNYMRQYLSMAFAMLVVPQQFALSRAAEAFDEQGGLKDEKSRNAVQGVLAALVKVGGAMKGTSR